MSFATLVAAVNIAWKYAKNEAPNLNVHDEDHKVACWLYEERAGAMSEPLLEVKNLKTYFPIKGGVFSRTIGHVKAVDGVSFTIDKGEVFGLVGESGSGKTTIGKTILRLVQKTEGEVKFKGQDVHALSNEELRKHRPNMQLVFQDPFSSLDPRMRIGEALGEPMLAHGLATKENVREKVIEVLELCGLAPYHIDRYPHEFSGG